MPIEVLSRGRSSSSEYYSYESYSSEDEHHESGLLAYKINKPFGTHLEDKRDEVQVTKEGVHTEIEEDNEGDATEEEEEKEGRPQCLEDKREEVQVTEEGVREERKEDNEGDCTDKEVEKEGRQQCIGMGKGYRFEGESMLDITVDHNEKQAPSKKRKKNTRTKEDRKKSQQKKKDDIENQDPPTKRNKHTKRQSIKRKPEHPEDTLHIDVAPQARRLSCPSKVRSESTHQRHDTRKKSTNKSGKGTKQDTKDNEIDYKSHGSTKQGASKQGKGVGQLVDKPKYVNAPWNNHTKPFSCFVCKKDKSRNEYSNKQYKKHQELGEQWMMCCKVCVQERIAANDDKQKVQAKAYTPW